MNQDDQAVLIILSNILFGLAMIIAGALLLEWGIVILGILLIAAFTLPFIVADRRSSQPPPIRDHNPIREHPVFEDGDDDPLNQVVESIAFHEESSQIWKAVHESECGAVIEVVS